MVRYGEFENLNSSRAADYATSTISSAADTISYVSWRVSALLPSPRRRSGDRVALLRAWVRQTGDRS
jgi:hypothetical protein